MNGGVNEAKNSKGPSFGIRHVQILLVFLNITCVYMNRMSISVIIVAMTNAETTNPNFREFDWSEKERNYIISSFYWGHMMTQIPAGYLNRRFGSKIVMFSSTFFSASLALFTPYLVTIGSWQAYCAIRVLQGLIQGAIFPSIHVHIATWSPPLERYVLGALAYSGINCGIVFAMLFSSLIASSPFGWPGISYIIGGINFAWCVVWLIFGAKNPTESRYITVEECQYIDTSLNRGNDFHKKKIPVPWLAMLTSVPFLTLIFAFCCEAWSFSTLQNQIPSYLNGVLNMNMRSNALFSTLPYIARWIMGYVYAFLGKMAVEKNWITLTNMRKTANTLGTWIPTLLLIGVGFLGEADMELIISLLVVCVGFEAGSSIGALLSAIDLAPNHAGVVVGIVNSIACLIPIANPLMVGAIVTNVHDRSEWQIVFGISAVVGFFGNLLFILLGSSEAAPWDAPDFLLKQSVEEPVNNSETKTTFKVTSVSDHVRQVIKSNE